MAYYVDTHTHLFAKEFDDDIDEVIKNSIEKNVKKFIVPNIDQGTIESLLKLTDRYPGICFPAIGLHPSSVGKDFGKELEVIEKYLLSRKFYAIGEAGIDLYRDKTFREEQTEVFMKHILMAKKYDLPLIIHSRKSLDEIILILEKESGTNLRGVFHCYPGNTRQAGKIIEMGFVLGIGGVVTYKNAGLAGVIKNIDISDIVLETDSPYLSPVPLRGKRNDSSNIVHIAQKISELKNIHLDEIAEITTNTAVRLFNI